MTRQGVLKTIRIQFVKTNLVAIGMRTSSRRSKFGSVISFNTLVPRYHQIRYHWLLCNHWFTETCFNVANFHVKQLEGGSFCVNQNYFD